MHRLLALAAGQTARLINISDLASPFQLSRPTIRDYVTLLERVFLKGAAGKRFAAGVVLYDGETSVSFEAGLHAVPIRALWETT